MKIGGKLDILKKYIIFHFLKVDLSLKYVLSLQNLNHLSSIFNQSIIIQTNNNKKKVYFKISLI